VLTQAQQVRQITLEQAKLGYPVHLQAVVTYFNAAEQDLFVQDSSAGIWVNIGPTKLRLRPGQRVDLEGVSEFKDFAPQIGKPRLRILGQGKLPKPRRVSFASMISAREDSQWVEVEGVIHSGNSRDGHLDLDLVMEGGRLKARIPNFWQPVPTRLVDARVRIRGACGAEFNQRNQFVGVMLYVPSLAFLEVVERPPADPFDLPMRPIGSLAGFSLQPRFGHRVRVQGVVTLSRQGRSLFVEDKSGNAYVQTSQHVSVLPGDRVDVLGFPAVGQQTAMLLDAVVRILGHATPPPPALVTATEALRASQDGHLVRLEARLRDSMSGPSEQLLLLESGDQLFNAQLEDPRAIEKFSTPPAQSWLQVTGICAAEEDESRRRRAVGILLRAAGDVVVLQRPPWLTLWHALLGLGIMAALILGALGWVVLLRRRVREQTAVIREQLRREAALREQYQELFENAHEMVFTCGLRGHVTSLNRAGEQLLLSTRTAVIGRHIGEILTPESAEMVRGLFDRERPDERPRTVELDLLGRDGKRTPVEVSLRAILSEGYTVGWQGTARDITERKRAEEALRHGIERDRAVAGSVSDMIYEWDLKDKVEWVGDVDRLLGYAPGTFPRTLSGWAAALHPEDKQRVWRAIEGHLKGEAGYAVEYRIADRGGGWHWWSARGVALRDEQDQPRVWVGAIRDITERKQAEEALRKSEERYRLLYERSLAGIFHSTLDGRLLDCNDACARIFGYASREELLRQSAWDLYCDVPDRRALIGRLQQEKSLTNVELHLKRRDGSAIWVLENASLVEPSDGGPAMIEGTVVDITDRTAVQRALQESERRYRLLAENVTDVIWIMDLNLRYTYISPSVMGLRGVTPEEAMRERLEDTLAPGSVIVARATLAEEQREEAKSRRDLFRSRTLEVEQKRKDGSTVWTEVRTTFLRDSEGRPVSILGVTRDISARKAAEDSLRRISGRILQMQDEERRRIARELHDTTAQSLAALAINLSVVKDSAPSLSPRALACLSESLGLAEQCAREIRTLSYLLHPPLLDEVGLASALLWYTEGFAQRSGIEIDLDVAPEVARLPGDVELTLYRVVQEGLANIHLHSGSKRARIRLEGRRDQIVLTVADEGRGIPPPILEGAGDYPAELGVGIAGMRERMRQLGGRLDISSSARGTTLTAILPVRGGEI
jgi:PAS domain S-box-containing protein